MFYILIYSHSYTVDLLLDFMIYLSDGLQNFDSDKLLKNFFCISMTLKKVHLTQFTIRRNFS